MEITTRYAGDMRFESGEGAARVTMDGAREAGGAGEAPTPKHLVLHGLAGCTGMDVAFMLHKQRIPFQDFSIHVEADQTSIHPKVFKTIRVVYRISAAGEHRRKVERAVEQSRTTFCGVSAMLARGATLTHEIEFTALP